MKIIFAIKKLENIAGGAEKVLTILASELVKRGHIVKVISFDKYNAEPFYKFHKDIQFIRVNEKNKFLHNRFFQFINRILLLRKEISISKPDIVVGFMHSIYVLLSFSLIGKSVNLIASEHIVPEYYKNRKIEYLLINISTLFIKKFTVISDEIKNMFSPLIRNKMEALPNPVTYNLNSKEKKSKTKFQILAIGRLNNQKNHEVLIRAFALLINEFPQWKLKIVGDGILRSKLLKLIEDLNISKSVFLQGISLNIEKNYSESDIFVMPSKFESFGLVTAEAMAHSLPVIGFNDCPGTNKLIKNNHNGYLVEPGINRAYSLSIAMKKLMKSDIKRHEFGQLGYAQIKKYYSTEVIIDLWEQFLMKNKS